MLKLILASHLNVMRKNLLILLCALTSFFCYAQSENRLTIVSAIPNVQTNQDYSPWLNDDLNDMVQGTWGNNDPNRRYADVHLKFAAKSRVSRISLYDYQGVFPADHLTYIFLVNGPDTTRVGTFDGSAYMAFIDYPVNNILADAIVIRKFGNDIPHKVRAYGTAVNEPVSERLSIISAIPNVQTNQDYSPWLNDDFNDLVQTTWGNNDPNRRYADVNLKLAQKSRITTISLYDYQGVFPANQLTYIYTVNGTDSTFIGTFDGSSYLSFINYQANAVLADAVVIRKFGNDIPQKVRVYGYADNGPVQSAAVITFPELPAKLSTDLPFVLDVSSNNTEVPVQLSSSDNSILTLVNEAGHWKGQIHKEGTVNITASQAASAHFTAAVPVTRTLLINKVPDLPLDTVSRLSIASIIPDAFTGQDYLPWLSDDLDSLVQTTYGNNDINNRYVDVALWLAKRSLVTKVSLYDYNGQFPADHLTYIYAVKGSDSTFLGTFNGDRYLAFVDYTADSVLADAIVIRKFGNDIPQKVRVYGIPLNDAANQRITSVISFPAIPALTTATSSVDLTAGSTNTSVPLVYQSSDPSVVSVSNGTGSWKAFIHKEGTAVLTASQAGNNTYIPAMPVSRTLIVTKEGTSTNPGPGPVINSPKIPLDGKRWYVLDNNITLDELNDGIANSQITVAKGGSQRPVFEAYYPLRDGESMVIKALRMFDGSGIETDTAKMMRLYLVTDTWQRILIATFRGERYLSWVGPSPADQDNFNVSNIIPNARLLMVTGNGIFPTELELYGDYVAGATPTQAQKKPVKLKEMFAVNGFEWDFIDLTYDIAPNKLKLAKTFTGFRHYMEWNRMEGVEGEYSFNPTRSGGWNYDAIYEKCKEEGIEVLGCIKGLPEWMVQTYPDIPGGRDYENVPARYGKDLSDPASYVEQAKMAFQYAARYGSNKNVDRSLLSVNGTPRWSFDPVNVVKVGMDLVKYMECENERDKTWKVFGYQTGREYAANLSAWYDGHKNTLGPGIGVKNADPNMKVAMCGIASVETDYVRGMVDWCREFRGYNADGTVNLCWDIVNYHAYSNDSKTSQSGTYTRGAAPEIGGLAEVASDFIQMSHEISKDMEVWVTETGYDLSPGSPLRAIPIGNKSAEDVQADWILRTSLLYAREGIKRVFFYLMYDQSTMNNFTQFATSGLLTDEARKPAGDFIFQTNKLFGEYTYKESLSKDPVVDKYQLNDKIMYTLYVPDEVDRKANYTLNLNASDSVYIYTPLKGADNMSLQKLKPANGVLSLQLTETPIFVSVIKAPRALNTFVWTGDRGTSPDSLGNWRNTASNSVNELPDENSTVQIPAGLSRYPVLSTPLYLKNMTIQAGANLSLNGNTLYLKGNLNNSGTIENNGNYLSAINFNGKDSLQLFVANAQLNNTKLGRLIVDNTYGLSILQGKVNVYDHVQVLKGSLSSNGNLTLKASENGFASLLELPSGSAVNGNVNVEVYYTGGNGNRGIRAIASPLNDLAYTGNKSILQLKNFSIITGTGGVANGFDPGSPVDPFAATLSSYYEPATNAQANYVPISSIYQNFSQGTGLLFFYRGDRSGYNSQSPGASLKLNPPYAIPENTNATFSGVLNQGNITVPLTYTYREGEDSSNGLNLVGNPYACAIDWKRIARNKVHDLVIIPKSDGSVASYSQGVTSNAGQIEMRYIQPGQGFYVQAAHRDSAFITFSESSKVGGKAFVGRLLSAPEQHQLSGIFGSTEKKSPAAQLFRLSIKQSDAAEETVIVLKNEASRGFDANDGDVPYISTNRIQLSSLAVNGQKAAINFTPKAEEIKLYVNLDKSGVAELSFSELPSDKSYWLTDHYLNYSKEIHSEEIYSFSIDKSNAKTFGNGRFAISSTPQAPVNSDLKLSLYPNPTENILHLTLQHTASPRLIRIYNLSGEILKQKITTENHVGIDVTDMVTGVYLAKIFTADGNEVVALCKFVKK